MAEIGPLLDRLSVAAQALSPQSIVPLLSHFWFLGDGRVVAFNDIQAVEAQTEAKVRAAIPGQELCSILGTFAPTATYTLQETGGMMEFKCGGSTIHLPFLELNDPPFAFPSTPPEDTIVCGEGFFKGLRRCLLSTGSTAEKMQMRGVTLARAETGLVMYATDNVTLSRYLVPSRRVPLIKAPIMLPGQFCEQVLAAYAKTEEKSPVLRLYAGGAVIEFGDQVKVFSKLDVAPSLNFDSTVAVYFKEADLKHAQPIPEELKAAMDRLVILADKSKDKVSLWQFSKKGLVLTNRDSKGPIHENITIKSALEKEFVIDTPLIQRALQAAEEIVVTEDSKAVALLGDERKFLHLVAHYG